MKQLRTIKTMGTTERKPGKMVPLNDINRRLTEFRNKAPGILGISFEEILQRCGITEKYYLFCEHGRRRLRADHLARLQSEFKLNSNRMLGSNDPMFLLEVDFNPLFKEFRETAPGILGIPFDEILQKCGISEEDYLAYELGLKKPHYYHLFTLSKEFNLNINWFYGVEDSMFADSGCLEEAPVNLSDHSSRSVLFKEAMENPDVENFFLSLTDFLLSLSQNDLKSFFQSWAGLHQSFNRISDRLSEIFAPRPE